MITNSYDTTAKMLLDNKVGLVPAETVYGISCLATNAGSIARIYDIKCRGQNKPFIVLVPSVESLTLFGIDITTPHIAAAVQKYWPGPVSLIFDVSSVEHKYLHRGTNSLAFRLPDHKQLTSLLQQTGPIVSTSANKAGKSPVLNMHQAQEIFGDSLDFYLDAGELSGKPSKVIKVIPKEELVLRD